MKTNTEYVAAILNGEFPQNQTYVPLDKPFVDSRGSIQNLVLTPASVACITSKKGSIRANHYHKTDWHFSYVISGKVFYFERPLGSIEIPSPIICAEGTMFFTPPMTEHSMLFVEDSIIITVAKNQRSHDNHESDVVRMPFITQEIADKYTK
jgi:dTDP-4-dehydrorhamnose 3,5-epimerase-like enzyme